MCKWLLLIRAFISYQYIQEKSIILENSQKIWSKSHAEALATELRIKVCSRSQRYQIEPSKYKSMGSTVTIYDDGGFWCQNLWRHYALTIPSGGGPYQASSPINTFPAFYDGAVPMSNKLDLTHVNILKCLYGGPKYGSLKTIWKWTLVGGGGVKALKRHISIILPFCSKLPPHLTSLEGRGVEGIN